MKGRLHQGVEKQCADTNGTPDYFHVIISCRYVRSAHVHTQTEVLAQLVAVHRIETGSEWNIRTTARHEDL